ncbi:phosphoglycerate mutase family protein [Tritrichomonas foetus]|uniref:Phosphoglycerate mutase family protein n=1 Tax=Tritrichomonas foetus TaxID=1144522 RepID=A0A1J4KUN4_9EUKA|nr:phosphoglycerate mutase family protein [Tritrichomonas foetus]|eukprot:OHT14850.1 phosphoglycerate mutase family protein [Tritrichomonas foetus]
MKQRIVIVRHGESAANAGSAATTPFSEIPLTEKGKVEAQEYSKSVNEKPDLIICSSFLRAKQTSQPLRDKFPDVPFEINNDIHEFAYLNPDLCIGTTVQERRQRVIDFWAKQDPSYQDCDSTESFAQFVARAKSFLVYVHQKEERHIIVFSHFLFMKLLELIIDNPNDSDLELMKKYPEYKETKDIKNCGTIEIP